VSNLRLGVIADDITGGTDAASALKESGLSTLQIVSVPTPELEIPDADAVVVSLKSRTALVADAVRWSEAALGWLRTRGASTFILKICSTFDSTPKGNIGPVAEALLVTLDGSLAPVCPAAPEHGRIVRRGDLFVNGQPLAESPMAHHPLTPMTDSSVVRLLQAQVQGRVVSIPHERVQAGASSVQVAFLEAQVAGARFAVVDALTQTDLEEIVTAAKSWPLSVGAAGLVRAFGTAMAGRPSVSEPDRSRPPSPTVVIAGSSSAATRAQIAEFAERRPAIRVDPLRLAGDEFYPEEIVQRSLSALDGADAVLVYTSASPEEVRATQAKIGKEAAAEVIERGLSRVGLGVVAGGVHRLVVAGGETSGAQLRALGVRVLRIGDAIAPGVPWTYPVEHPSLALALKSGNFGGPTFFSDAVECAS
jgi:uncharacterized protein YgbK (DUF1537 family)